MKKQTEYQRGRDDGLDLARRLVEEGGLESLLEEIRFRNITGISTSLARKDLDKAAEEIKKLTCETMVVAWVSVLHDEFGFGSVRCQRAVNAFNKLTGYLANGWLYWNDLIEELKTVLRLVHIDTSQLTAENLGRNYSHPDPDDIYEEADLIVEDDWRLVLNKLSFSEKPSAEDPGWMDVMDNTGRTFMRYKGQYDKICVYDGLVGMLIARDELDWKPPEPELPVPPQTPAQKPQQKKRKKRKR